MLAKESVEDRLIRLGLIREMHHILLESVCGQDKEPGQFRNEQNWIGTAGCTIEQATFVQPNPLQLMDHLHQWEAYLGADDIDPIVQTAIVHAQFELLHPFKDGNGRIGRLLIPLFLSSKKLLARVSPYSPLWNCQIPLNASNWFEFSKRDCKKTICPHWIGSEKSCS